MANAVSLPRSCSKLEGNHGRFAKGPTEIGVAEFGAAQPLDLAGASHRAFDQPAIAQEVFDRGEAFDRADLVQDGQAETIADAWHALEQGKVPTGMCFGEVEQPDLQQIDLHIVMANHGQVVLQGELAQRMIFGGEQSFFPGIAIAPGLLGRGAVVCELMRGDSGQQLGAAPDVDQALAQQRAQGTTLGRIDVSGWNEVGAKQVRDLLAVDSVVLVFAAVNRLQVERVGEDEAQARLGAGIGQPVPTEHAFATDRQAVAIRLDQLEEELEVVVPHVAVDELSPLVIHHADVHLPGVEIDSAVEFGRGAIILHVIME